MVVVVARFLRLLLLSLVVVYAVSRKCVGVLSLTAMATALVLMFYCVCSPQRVLEGLLL